MTPESFRAAQAAIGISGKDLGKALGKSECTIVRYRQDGVAERESLVIRLALAAIKENIKPMEK